MTEIKTKLYFIFIILLTSCNQEIGYECDLNFECESGLQCHDSVCTARCDENHPCPLGICTKFSDTLNLCLRACVDDGNCKQYAKEPSDTRDNSITHFNCLTFPDSQRACWPSTSERPTN